MGNEITKFILGRKSFIRARFPWKARNGNYQMCIKVVNTEIKHKVTQWTINRLKITTMYRTRMNPTKITLADSRL